MHVTYSFLSIGVSLIDSSGILAWQTTSLLLITSIYKEADPMSNCRTSLQTTNIIRSEGGRLTGQQVPAEYISMSGPVNTGFETSSEVLVKKDSVLSLSWVTVTYGERIQVKCCAGATIQRLHMRQTLHLTGSNIFCSLFPSIIRTVSIISVCSGLLKIRAKPAAEWPRR